MTGSNSKRINYDYFKKLVIELYSHISQFWVQGINPKIYPNVKTIPIQRWENKDEYLIFGS